MNRPTLFALIPALLLPAPSGLAAGPALVRPPASIAVLHPWIALPPGGAPTAAAYAVIRNDGAVPDTFLGAATPAAQNFQLHSMSMASGVMRMRAVEAGVSIGAGQSLTLKPGGAYHFMVVRPDHPLKLGDRIPAVLTFAKAGAVKTVFVVETPPAPAMMMH